MTPKPRRFADDDADRYVRERREDYDRLARVNVFFTRYKIFWVPIVVFFGAMGFGVITPRRTAEQLQDQITALNVKYDELYKTHQEMHELLSILVRNLCYKATTQEAALLGLTQETCK